MEYYLAVYSSVTLANRVKQYMSQYREYAKVIHAPKHLTKGGCSYALRFKKDKLSVITQISEHLGIKIKGLYKESIENNKKVYVPID